MFPVNDLGRSSGLLVSVDSSKDLSFAELEQVMAVTDYVQPTTNVVDGLSFSDEVIAGGVKVLLAVVEGMCEMFCCCLCHHKAIHGSGG